MELFALPATEAEAAAEMARAWLDFWKFTGSAAATLAAILFLFLIHYWKVLLPREQAKTEDQRTESKARSVALVKTAETSEKLVDQQAQIVASQDRLATLVEAMDARIDDYGARLNSFGDRLSDVWRHIRGDSDPDQHVLKE